ncbi:hypothetical protein BT96DRAFT_986807 [Gymnopus androsaceus JB14]|uniref:Protein ROT1 n=1 Tax=Gymnopus androsaceus JB14 TaxID=1447944 RepID=A0A6A4I5F6_9AGAR|nr:hypothetical protein BT96DRAFT_986807 [Gymnopus androsaceus JB14]
MVIEADIIYIYASTSTDWYKRKLRKLRILRRQSMSKDRCKSNSVYEDNNICAPSATASVSERLREEKGRSTSTSFRAKKEQRHGLADLSAFPNARYRNCCCIHIQFLSVQIIPHFRICICISIHSRRCSSINPYPFPASCISVFVPLPLPPPTGYTPFDRDLNRNPNHAMTRAISTLDLDPQAVHVARRAHMGSLLPPLNSRWKTPSVCSSPTWLLLSSTYLSTPFKELPSAEANAAGETWYEIARYCFTSTVSQPACITAIMIWVHGTYAIQSNDYNDTELIPNLWYAYYDPTLGSALQLYSFDGTPLAPMHVASMTPNMPLQ